MKKKNTPARRKTQTARKKTSWLTRWLGRADRFVKRVPWISLALCSAAFIALVLVEASVADVIHRMTPDPITAVIFVASAVLASLGVVFGPLAIRSIKSHTQRKFAEKVVWACFALSVWNLSTTLANAQSQMTADAIRSAPTYQTDVVRLASLNRQIDSLSDETAYSVAADTSRTNFMGERDTLAERLEGANPQPILFAWANDGWIFWAKAALFHALVFGFSVAFAFQLKPRRAATKSKGQRRSVKSTDNDNVVAVAF